MTEQSPDLLRLNKYLALHMAISRREADNIIAMQDVEINGRKAELGARYIEGDKITVNGKTISNKTKYEYIALNKPVGYVCSRRQQGDHPTVYAILPKTFQHLKPVGRLDRDSSGIILLTNDGDFAYRMTHPSFQKIKQYNVRLDNELAPLHQQMINDYGIALDDGPSKLQLERMNDNDRLNWIVTMHEGRNRQIRRTFNSLGYTVTQLHRTNFGNYSVNDIKSGEYKIIDVK